MVAIQIIIPSYGRPADLRRCLAALQKQTMPDFEILCVCRVDDAPTRESLLEFQSQDHRIKEVLVECPGLVAAMNAGLRQAQAPFVTFTDDDSEAPSHWLATILSHFDSHPECGAAGGPDRLQLDQESLRNPPPVKKVGRYTWTGKFHASHHCPIDVPFVQVDILKGVNMTYRTNLIARSAIGEGLRGGGAQVGTEPGLAAILKRQGKELHFLRDAWVFHHPAPRRENDDRMDLMSSFSLDSTYNNTFVLWRYQPLLLALTCQLRTWLIGSRRIPGVFRLIAHSSKLKITLTHFPVACLGALHGLQQRKCENPHGMKAPHA
jgi:glycosyltransferase involved in cell wall biosynthesis